jgi:multidrug resistance efflux pump
MLLQRFQPAVKLLPILFIIAVGGWWGLHGVGTGQPRAASTGTTTSAVGQVEGASDPISLGTAATGTIAELLVSAGTHVHAGQHLLQLECSDVARALEARQSDFAAAVAIYLRTLHGPRPEEISVGVANVNLAEARLQEARKSLQRTRQLREGFTVTQVQIDQAERDERMDAAMLDEVRAKLALLKAGSREEDITETRSRRDAAMRRVDKVTALLAHCSVNAPITGVVLSTNVNAGQLVSTKVPVALLTMVDDSTLRVRAYVDEGEIPKLCLGQHVQIAAEGIAGGKTDGIVENLGVVVVESPFAPSALRQFRQVILSIPNRQQELPIGLRVSVQFSPCVSGQGNPGR